MKHFHSISLLIAASCAACLDAQTVGANVNMVSGAKLPDGDPYLQRQTEPSLAVSSRNPLHLLGFSNDTSTVDIPFPPDDDRVVGDSWVRYYKSFDGGVTWRTSLVPGYPQDVSPQGLASPLKAYQVGTDPTVRAGTHGLFHMSGLVFNRGDKAPSALYYWRMQDQNNKEFGDTIQPLGNPVLLERGNDGQFVDKPWIATDIPRSAAPNCNINGKSFAGGNVYVVYTMFLGNSAGNPHSRIVFMRSTDCGATWGKSDKVTEGVGVYQGATLAVEPVTGAVYIAWRREKTDAFTWVRSTDAGRTFSKPADAFTFAPNSLFDQSSPATTLACVGPCFRTLALPSLAADAFGRVYMAWSQRGVGPGGDARVMVSSLALGSNTWSAPVIADPSPARGSQFLPATVIAFGKLTVMYYDLRDDGTSGEMQCPAGQFCNKASDLVEVRVLQGDRAAGHPEKVFTETISDTGLLRRHTVDVRAVQSDVVSSGLAGFFPSVRVSQYRFGSRPGQTKVEQLQYNPPNLPIYAQGKKPFIGDYIDIAAQPFTLTATGQWQATVSAAYSGRLHGTWSDNRDVRTPPISPLTGKPDWTLYTPVGSTGGTSQSDPTQSRPVCVAAATGSRNQNVYTAALSPGLVAGLRGNYKQLKTAAGGQLQRGFAVFIQNTTKTTKTFRLTIPSQPPSQTTAPFGRASFAQFPAPPYTPASPAAVTQIDVTIPPRSSASRTVWITSSDPKANVAVNVVEVSAPGGTLTPGGLAAAVTANPDVTNPDVANPDVANPDVANPDVTTLDVTNPDVATAEVYNPSVTNPDVVNPDVANPDVANPDVTNPDVTNPDVVNPDVVNPDVTNPDVTSIAVANPDVVNPDVANPDVVNPDVANPDVINPDVTAPEAGAGITDYTWKLSNKGNTAASYNAKLLLKNQTLCCPEGCQLAGSCPAGCYKCQLILHRVYTTPVAKGCTLAAEPQNITVANIINPAFTAPTTIGAADLSASAQNATMALAPGESGRMTLRVFGLLAGKNDPLPATRPAAISNGVNTTAVAAGITAPAASLLITTTQVPVGIVGTAYNIVLTSIGGAATPARFWAVIAGSLPTGLNLNPSTGAVTGTPTGTGTFTATISVLDAAAPPSQIDKTDLTFLVNKLSVASVTAYQQGIPGDVHLKANESATVLVNVSNEGPATALGATPGTLAVAAAGAGGACTAASPLPLNLGGGSTQTYTYTCGPVSGNGTLTFTATATAGYNAGVTTASAPLASNSITVDTTAPVLAVSSAPYTAGSWTNQNVTVNYTCTDNLSGVAGGYPTGSATLSAETAGTTLTGTCIDLSGNISTLDFGPVRIDKTAPSISGSRAPLANAAGWNNTDVTAAFACTDALSGVATAPVSPQVVSTEGAGQSRSATCIDAAGNSASATVASISIDKTVPVIAYTGQSPAANAAGWNKTDVTLGWGCSDTLSGPVSATLSQVLTAEAAGQTASATCTDKAGNTAANTQTGINIDKTAPTLNYAAQSPAANAEGWNNTNVALAFTAADTLSGVASTSIPSPLTLTAEGAAVSGSVTVTDVAGNSAAFVSPAAKIDKTAPGIAYTGQSPAANVAGWNNTNVTLGWACSDGLSGAISATLSQTLSAEGAGQSASATCTDRAGNTASHTKSGINIDKTAPNINGSRAPLANSSGWNNTDVTVGFACTDTGSGLAAGSPPAATVLSAQGTNLSASGTCLDLAGNSASATVGGINIDKTAPVASIASATPANPAGWNKTDVTVTFAGTDSGSGIDACTAPVTLSTEGAGQSSSGTCTDKAGNVSPAVVKSGINIDKTAPTISGSRSPLANAFGWVNTDVTVSAACADTGSGIPAGPAPSAVVSSEGGGQSRVLTCGDVAGNSSSVTISGISIDKTPPAAAAAVSPAPNPAGWNNSNVTVTFAGLPPELSGIDSCTAPVILSADGAGQSATGTCTDKAGNVSAAVVKGGINIDKTAPSISGSRSPLANALGWANTDVTVTAACTDPAGSGIPPGPAPTALVSSEGPGQSRTLSCQDLAGNSSSVTIGGISIDKTPPTAAASASPAPNAAGWNNSNVTVTFAGLPADLSGIDSCTAAVILSADGAGQSASGTCTDKAGNVSAAVVKSGINIDKTAPSISGSRSPLANAFGWVNTDVTVTAACTDPGGSGIPAGPAPTAVVSSEGGGQSRVLTCVDVAGNPSSVTISGISIDKTPPAAAAAASPAPNAAGWNNSNVTVTFAGLPPELSGIDSCTAPVILSAEGAGQSASGTCTDKAGNVSAPVSKTGINIDKTLPSISGSRSPLANAFGWVNTDVTVSAACTDAGGSGIPAGPAPTALVSSEGAGQSRTLSCLDLAGNSSSVTISGISVDKTRPIVTALALPAANPGGWNNSNVTVSFNPGLDLSGIDTCTPAVVLSAEGAGQSASGTCADKAGNVSLPATKTGINIDKTPPTIGVTTPANAASYVLNAAVAANYACADALALASCVGTGPNLNNIDTTSLGAKLFSVTATDLAGNISTVTVPYTVIAPPPSISFTDFSSLAGLSLNGPAAAGPANVLRLTSLFLDQTSAVWYNTKQHVTGGFTTQFQFRITSPSTPADGFAFVIQNSPSGTATHPISGIGGGGLGYDGLPNSVAVEFDTYQNAFDVNSNHIAIQSNGAAANTVIHGPGNQRAINYSLPFFLADGAVHTVKIDYTAGVLKVFLDGSSTAAMSAAIDLTTLGLDGTGSAWVGFTAATGALTENTDLLNWSFTLH